MLVEIVTPDSTLYKGEIKLAQLPGIDGSFEILNNHAPMVSALTKGKVKLIEKEGKTEYVEIKGGVLEVKDNKIIVLAE